jgi:phage shock protein PspC (stress-responsive transcriptional regulator)
MSDQTTSPGRAGRAPLRRERRSKVIAGVCGGLGRHLDIDPVVFRILFAVLSFVGGIGLLAYAAAWLFVPAEGAPRSEAHRMLTGSNPLLAALAAVGLAVGALASISALTNGLTAMWPLWMIAAAVLGVLVWRGDIKLGRARGTGASEQPPTWWQQPPAGDMDGGVAVGTVPTTTSAEGAEPQDAVPDAPPSSWADLSGLSGPSGSSGVPGPGAAGAGHDLRTGEWAGAVERPRRRGYGGLALAGLLAATGAVGVLDAAGLISLTWLSGGALVLVILGGAMVVGGMFGKTTALVPIGVVLAVPLILLAAVGVPLHGTIGDEHWAPASAAEVRPSYQLGVGDGELDLTNAAPGAGQTLKLSAGVGVGDLTVDVPANVKVLVHAHAGIGSIEDDTGSDSTITGRMGHDETFTIPAQGTPAGLLVLNVSAGIGDVSVVQQ